MEGFDQVRYPFTAAPHRQSDMDIIPTPPRAPQRRTAHTVLGIAIAVVMTSTIGVLLQGLVAEADPVAAPAAVATLDADPAPRIERAAALRAARATRKPAARLPRTCGASTARTVRFRVSVQDGLKTTRAAFAEQVVRILCDERSWSGGGRVRFRYDPNARTVIALRSAYQTERRCLQLIGLSVHMKYSCASRPRGEAVINADRWFGGSPSWRGSVARYRALVINHEVGHLLGRGHLGCRGGGPAPVMMQQSKGTGSCHPNPWPLSSEVRAVR